MEEALDVVSTFVLFFLPAGLCGSGGIFSMRRRTKSSLNADELDKFFRATGSIPKEIMPAFLEAVGAVVLAWGTLEIALHLIVVTAYDDGGGKCMGEEFPRALKRKTSFLRKACKKLPSVVLFADEIISLAREIDDLSDRRNEVIHSIVTGFDNVTERIDFTSLDANKDGHLIKVSRYSVLEMNQLSLECARLGGVVAQFHDRFHDGVMAQTEANNSSGAITS
ncbi:MAG: hypothetical protein KGO02_14525 [Alphaproteobacteria bacterium]|nr:hypothetical protein [Alphaproteobacteria bacterium]